MQLADAIRSWARRIKRDAVMLWFAQRHPGTPWLARLVCIAAVAYALSPIDLIPDFIPVLGYIDDALLVPALVWLAVRLLPADVVAACRRDAERWLAERQAKPVSWLGAAPIVLLWLGLAYAGWRWWSS